MAAPTPSLEGESEDSTQMLLTQIVAQLKILSDRLADGDGRHHSRPPTASSIHQHPATISPEPPHSSQIAFRTGPLLKEALQRYRTNAVPRWSTIYGGHDGAISPSDGDGIEPLEAAARRVQWEALAGQCWKIPHDNRVGLCFQFAAGESDGDAPARLRRWLHGLHGRQRSRSMAGGRTFHVWDWFDGGLSAYWYPGCEEDVVAGLDQRAPAIYGPERRGATASGKSIGRGGEKGQGTDLSPLVAPWRRIINIQGLTTVDKRAGTAENLSQLRDLDLCPILLANTGDTIFQHPVSDVVWKAVRYHLGCSRSTEARQAEFQTKGCVVFHTTFYEMLQRRDCEDVVDLWPCGDLHGDEPHRGGQGRRLRESAVTVIAVPGVEVPGPAPRASFWTILFLRPEGFPHPYYLERRDDLAQGVLHEMMDDVAEVVYKTLLSVIERWEELAGFFDELLCEKRALLDPAHHDSLLTDDGSFSRSKRYFWAIEFLKEAEKGVGDNVKQTRGFLETLRAVPPLVRAGRREYQGRVKRVEGVLGRLEGLRGRFSSIKNEAIDLRDGLFNASAVMESRTSTKLAENIKLLTFVSIFFLPLSFCTSLWSINDELFSLSTLAIVMPVLAASTFAVVLGIEHISFFTRTLLPWLSAPFGPLVGVLGQVKQPRVRVKIPRYSRTSAWLRSWLPREKNIPKLERPAIDLDAIRVDVHLDVEPANQGNKTAWKDTKSFRAHTT